VPPEAFQAVGDGVVDFKKALEAAHKASVPYAFVEQDHSAIDPFDSIARSYAYLRKLEL
jgi:sugar phosphate isomerase/epimerase